MFQIYQHCLSNARFFQCSKTFYTCSNVFKRAGKILQKHSIFTNWQNLLCIPRLRLEASTRELSTTLKRHHSRDIFICWNIRLVIGLCVITRGALLLPLLPFRGKLSIVSDVFFLHFWILLRGQQAGQFINWLYNQTLHQWFSSFSFACSMMKYGRLSPNDRFALWMGEYEAGQVSVVRLNAAVLWNCFCFFLSIWLLKVTELCLSVLCHGFGTEDNRNRGLPGVSEAWPGMRCVLPWVFLQFFVA